MNEVIVLVALVFGLLAFFEPCTIATHTLFSVQLKRQNVGACCENLLTLWWVRTVFVSALLVLLVVVLPQPQWIKGMPALILALMGLLYIVSRFAYLPVPHVELFRLLPGGGRTLSHAIRLGLTLPACTLPLFAVLAGLVVTADSVFLAIVAGGLFAAMFTLPTALVAASGINAQGAVGFSRAARTAPFITAALMFAAALWLLLQDVEMQTILENGWNQADSGGLLLAFAAGFLFSFNPVSFASVPVVLAYVTKAHEPRRALLLGGAFIFGMILTHVVLGVSAALGGEWVQAVMGRAWGLFLGPLLILMGLIWPGWLPVRIPWMSMRARRVSGVWGAFLLAIPFSIAICPFCTPALLVALTSSAAIGSTLYGGLLLLAFALGRSIPVALGAWGMGWLESLSVLTRYQQKLELIAGIILILTGLYMLNEYFLFIPY